MLKLSSKVLASAALVSAGHGNLESIQKLYDKFMHVANTRHNITRHHEGIDIVRM